MTTYQTQLMNALDEQVLSKFWLGYFREAFRSEINDKLLECFQSSRITKADIARKLNKRPEQVTRWLSAPCNLEADTIADLALALGVMPKVRFEKIGEQRSNEQCHRLVTLFERMDTIARDAIIGRQFSHPAEGGTFATSGDGAGKTVSRSTISSQRMLANA